MKRHGWMGLVVMSFVLAMTSGCAIYSVSDMDVMPPRLMIATKSPRTLYIVLDPDKVPPTLPILRGGGETGSRITELPTFVTRDLVKAFSTYFADVNVVPPGTTFDKASSVVADVQIDRMEHGLGRGGTMTWAFALQFPGASEYIFSYAGKAASHDSWDAVFENAITGLLAGYTDKHIHQEIMKADAEAKSPPQAASTSL